MAGRRRGTRAWKEGPDGAPVTVDETGGTDGDR